MFNFFNKNYKKIFDGYFERQKKDYPKILGFKRSAPFMDNVDKNFYISSPNEEGYAEWRPLEIDKVNWDVVESKINIKSIFWYIFIFRNGRTI